MERKILLACSAGMSTSMVVNKMEKLAQQRNEKCEILALPASDAMDRLNEGWEIILLGPQVRFLETQFKQAAQKQGLDLPIAIIPFQDYAVADADKIFKLVEKTLVNFKK
ncbi:PTS sugar transporter subunit IIB [Spiroplasma endosymbiont of Crioceris asparagi]|uniref:PTS sugar transporter subunit IIB n=1 Tax=Spiroplasma endosymbiont of Crioceris asparagi TaxID=3066286 RepID=UPI0030CCBE3B